jgi:DNA repair exonuclease SbcCD ATPase subunit
MSISSHYWQCRQLRARAEEARQSEAERAQLLAQLEELTRKLKSRSARLQAEEKKLAERAAQLSYLKVPNCYLTRLLMSVHILKSRNEFILPLLFSLEQSPTFGI